MSNNVGHAPINVPNSLYTLPTSTPESITRTGSSNVVCGLSPDSLMFYCESRLRGIGEQIGRAVAQQQKSNADISALNDLHEALNQYSKGVNTDGAVKGAEGDAAFNEISAAYDAAIAKVGSDSELGKKLLDDKSRILNTNGTGGTDKIVLEHEMKAMTNNLETMVKDINGNSELQMINLQSLMSQRQAAVQLTTNLVQSLGDQMNKIAANIGH